MRSYNTTNKQLKKAVNAEWQTKETEYFEMCKNDIIPQILAVCMFTLKTRFGFGKKRINDFYYDILGTLKLIAYDDCNIGIKLTTQELIDMVKEKFDIDLDSEVRKNETIN